MDHHSLYMRDLFPDLEFQAFADVMCCLEVARPEDDACLKKSKTPRVSSYEGGHLDHHGVLLEDSFDLVQGLEINGGIQQHPHAVRQELPPCPSDEKEDQSGGGLI